MTTNPYSASVQITMKMSDLAEYTICANKTVRRINKFGITIITTDRQKLVNQIRKITVKTRVFRNSFHKAKLDNVYENFL